MGTHVFDSKIDSRNVLQDQDTPLHNAARGDNGEVAELLLRAGAALDAKNEVRMNPTLSDWAS